MLLNAVLFLVAVPAAFADVLPASFKLKAAQGNSAIGCITGQGKIISNQNSPNCFTFTSSPIGSQPQGPQRIKGIENCNATQGFLNCAEQGVRGSAFVLSGFDVEIVGTGTQFSIPHIPDQSDAVGLFTEVGSAQAVKFTLQPE